jgi:hypothetical protein
MKRDCSRNPPVLSYEDFCQLAGEIPYWIGSLLKLEYLYLGYNNLTGSIPLSLGNLSSLHRIEVQFHNLEGTIPQVGQRLLDGRACNIS